MSALSLTSSRLQLLITSLIIILLTGCGGSDAPTPEQRVKAVLEAIESAAEQRSLSGLMEHISESYTDHRGQSKEDIRRLIQLHYLRNQNIHIFTTVQSLIIEDDTATVELNAAMAATEAEVESEQGRLRANTHRFAVVLKSANQQDWLVQSVSWQRGWGSY
jgi:hypothetical protein